MSPVSLVPAIILFCLVLGAIYLLLLVTKADVPKDRFVSIDGLRGILAFSVFLHHSVIWYFFLRTDKWTPPPSQVYSHFGPGAVAMFFMITAFLFYSKLLDARTKGMDWGKLYVSRIYRIMPLYIFVVLMVFLVVGALSAFALKVDIFHILAQLAKWVFFIEVDVNGVVGTKRIVAGVVWTLAYEWLFYCSLAIVGRVIYRIPTSARVLVISGLFFLAFLAIVLKFYPEEVLQKISSFAGGIAAAYLVRKDFIRKYCSGKWASLVILALTALIFLYPGSFLSFVCMCLVFIMIAAGNEIFGLLTHRLTRYLGMVS